MNSITDLDRCTGCGVCAEKCSMKAIDMVIDEEGFYYPVINDKVCIDCLRCKRVCHCEKERGEKIREVSTSYYAVSLKKKQDLNFVSSGGFFWGIAQKIISNYGVVYGAVQDGIVEVRHTRAETLNDVMLQRRSKYLQSITFGIFEKVEMDLKEGRQVLFSGVGCQIAALYAYLEKDYNNLYSCEIVCHGVPSYKVFLSYIEETEKYMNDKITEICFRDKRNGWNNNYISVRMNRAQLACASSIHPFHKGYLNGYYSRKSCSNCKYAKLERMSDFVLADFWKYNGNILKEYRKKGISLVCCNTKKAITMLSSMSDMLLVEKVDEEQALKSCQHLSQSPKENNRNLFFEYYNKYGFFLANFLCTKPEWFRYMGINLLNNKRIYFYLQKKLVLEQKSLKVKIESLFRKRVVDFVKSVKNRRKKEYGKEK